MGDKDERTALRERLFRELSLLFLGDLNRGIGGVWTESRNRRMGELYERLQDGDKQPFSLVVGAGLTASVKLPAWGSLLGRLEVNTFDFQSGIDPKHRAKNPSDDYPAGDYPFYEFPEFHTQKAFSDAKDSFHITDPLELAEYIKDGFPGGKKWDTEKQNVMKTIVRQALEAEPKTYQKENKETYLYQTAEMCAKYFSTGNRRIVSYNYDNLLEWYIHRQHPALCPNAVYDRRSAGAGLNVYHIHGYLGLSGTDHENEESERIILTEDDYLELERYPYCWENYLLTRALYEGDSLFLGFSGDDYNFRRIMRGVSESAAGIKRYMIVSINDTIKSVIEMALDEYESADPPIEYLVRILSHWLEIRDKYWSKKGIVPIWATHDDCPKLIENLL